MPKHKLEYRRVPISKVTRAEDDSSITVEGYATRFDKEADLYWFTESIRQGAFAATLRDDDQVLLMEHEGSPLARRSKDTLELSENKKGLKMRATIDTRDPDAQGLAVKLERGDLEEMSIGFLPEKEEWDDTRDPPHRTIIQARLYEVSAVGFPAYDGTNIGLRSAKEIYEAHTSEVGEKGRSLALQTEHRKRQLRLEQTIAVNTNGGNL